MGEVDRQVLLEKFALLVHYLGLIRSRLPATVADLRKDEMLQFGILHLVQLAAQVVLDAALHIGAAESRRPPSEAKAAVVDLGDRGVIPRDLADRLAGMAGMRNVIVHEYAKVDLNLVHAACANDLGDLDAFAAAIAARYAL